MKIRTVHLQKTYRDADRNLTVIGDLSFDFPASGAVAIVGRSGTGKSTLLHILGGLDRPSGGSVLYDDVELSALAGDELALFRGRNVGFVFQFHHLLPEFSALENVAMPLIIAGLPDGDATKRATAMLDRVGLASRMKHRPGELSGGEQQRVAIARAVVSNPRVVLADEPTGNLDVETSRDIQRLLLEINRELSNVLIVVTHSLEIARNMDVTLEMSPGGTLARKVLDPKGGAGAESVNL